MYRSSLFLTAALVGTTIALVQPVAAAKSASEVEAISRAVAVEIKFKFRNNDGEIIDPVGSGVIVDRRGDLYTLVTNKHVVCGGQLCSKLPPVERYNLGLADGQQYRIQASSIRLLGDDLDLAIIQFRSNRNYAVAKVAAPGSLKVEDDVYTAGFPSAQPGFAFGGGKAIAVVNKRLTGDSGGYTVIYNAATLPGMSGGGVFDGNGQLVAIHGQGDQLKENTEIGADLYRIGSKIGFNRGIPVRWLVQNLAKVGINLGSRSTSDIKAARQQVPMSADEYFIAGFNRTVDPGEAVVDGKRKAIQELSKAIQINPKYSIAYLIRGIVYEELQEFQQSLTDYNQAIIHNPSSSSAYIIRANLKRTKFNDIQGALVDYNQGILINPQSPSAYNNRALLKTENLNNYDEALADYNQAILINPKYAEAYNNRGVLKYEKLNDNQGALADYNQAIKINPKYSAPYSNRANLKFTRLNDNQGALADYNQAIEINPKYAQAYYNRATLKISNLNDRAGAIQDLRQAARLFREQGNTQNAQLVIEDLRLMGVTE